MTSNQIDSSILTDRIDRSIEKFLAAAEPIVFTDRLDRWRVEASAATHREDLLNVGRRVADSVSDKGFREYYPDGTSIFVPSNNGFRVRRHRVNESLSFQNTPSEDAPDELMAACAESGVALDAIIAINDESVPLIRLLRTSRAQFVIQQDVAQSAVAYCSYFPQEPEWRNRFGEKMSYSRIAEKLTSLPLGGGRGAGSRNLYALTFLLRTDDECYFLNNGTRKRVEAYLLHALLLLHESQRANGSWHSDWASYEQSALFVRSSASPDQTLYITGSHLEWLLMLPTRLPADEQMLRSSLEFVVRAVENATSADLTQRCKYASPGIRSLCILRGAQ